MIRIRLLEEELLRLHDRGLLFGTTHTCLGQEGTAVGTLVHLRPGDRVFSNHRGHGHFLAQGGNPAVLIAEVMGRATGVNGGRGGSQHLHEGRFVSSGVQGGLLPIALGAAMAAKSNGTTDVVVAFGGDGTLGQGVLYETLNMASLWGAPVIFVVENNRIAQTTAVESGVAGSIALRASAMDIRTKEVDVVDIRDVTAASEEAFQHVRAGSGPFFLVLNTFRLGPHSKGDDERTDEEMRPWRDRDPLLALAKRIPADDRDAINREAADEIRQGVEEALAAPWPEPSVGAAASIALPRSGRSPVTGPGDRTARVVESLNRALHEVMDTDDSVYMIGEDIRDPYGGAFKVTKGLSERHGDRVIGTPISEAGIVGLASGMALAGKKSVVELMFGDFLALAGDQIVNSLGKINFLSSGNSLANVVIRTPMGGGRGYGATHSQNLEKMFLGVPGVNVVAASHVLDPGALLYNAIQHDPNPVLFVENKLLYPERVQQAVDGWMGDFRLTVTEGLYPTAVLNLTGADERDVTVVSYGRTAAMALDAAKDVFLDAEVVAEVVVVSQLSPLSLDGIRESAMKSERVLVVEEGTLESGWGAEVLARLIEEGFHGHGRRIGAALSPIPSSKPLEDAVLPSVAKVRAGIEDLVRRPGGIH